MKRKFSLLDQGTQLSVYISKSRGQSRENEIGEADTLFPWLLVYFGGST